MSFSIALKAVAPDLHAIRLSRPIWIRSPTVDLPSHVGQDLFEILWEPDEDGSAEDLYFCQLGLSTAGADIRQIRDRLGKEAYLVAVLPDGLASDLHVRLFDVGADDVIEGRDAKAIRIAEARGRRQLAAKKEQANTVGQLMARMDFIQAGIESLPTPVFFKDSAGIYVGCNTAFARFLGHSQEKIVGASVFDIAPSDLACVYHEADLALMRSGGSQLYEARVCTEDGIRDVVFHKAAIGNDEGEATGVVGAMLDVTERKRMEEQLRWAAEHDSLTQLPNRRAFFSHARENGRPAHNAGKPLAVIVIDIDHFKLVNDRYGHAAGDAVLMRMGEILKTISEERPECHFARAGGEEFFGLAIGYTLAQAEALCQEIRLRINAAPVATSGKSVAITASFGVAICEGMDDTLDAALARADTALYDAKSTGRDKVRTTRRSDVRDMRISVPRTPFSSLPSEKNAS